MQSADAIRITTPLTDEAIRGLRIGDRVLLTGLAYTARDAAHKRLVDLLERGEPLPVDLRGQVIYYVGPTPARPGEVIGSAGPTTATRMDRYAPLLHAHGVKATIGKGGPRSAAVVEALRRHTALYLLATGGAGALLGKHITASELVAYEDLGTEAIRRLTVRDFPLIVANDAHGGDLFLEGMRRYARAPS